MAEVINFILWMFDHNKKEYGESLTFLAWMYYS